MWKNQFFGKKISHLLLLNINLTIISLLPISPLLAQITPKASDAPLELNLLTDPNDSVITANTINPEKLTVPSLWWAKENSESKLLDNWIAYPTSARVDLIVNQQIWSLLDYVERYNFVNRLGTHARSFGYNIRVFNYQKEALATYTCNFNPGPISCSIKMNNQIRLGVKRTL